MKAKKPLSVLLSLCMLMTLLPVNALAAESLQEIKTKPGETYTYTEEDETHSQTVNKTFDFVVGDIAYRYLNGVDGDEEDRRRGPGRDFRPPELDIFANGGQFRHGHQDIQYPVVPAGGEAGKTAPVFVSKVAK